MNVMFRRPVSSFRRQRLNLSVLMLEDRKLMTTGIVGPPAVNLSAAAIVSDGKALANFLTRVDSTHAVTDLNHAATAINADISRLLAHPLPNAGFQRALLQFDVDALAVVDQAIADLTPPPPVAGGGGHVIAI
jgi:hypothetical protein